MESTFAAAEKGLSISKAERKQREPALRRGLLEAQTLLAEAAEFPLIIVFGGVDGAGKGELANKLTEWMDPRRINTHAYGTPTQEERERPEYWRFWRDLPPRGETGIFLSAWYHAPLIARVYDEIDKDQFEGKLQRVLSFEQQLVADGALILKYWMHLGKRQQEARFLALETEPLQSWRVTPRDWKHWRMYDSFVRCGSRLIERTSTKAARWTIVDGTDVNHRELTVGEHILRHLRKRLGLTGPEECSGTEGSR